MSNSAIPSPPSSEITGKPNPYQYGRNPGESPPRGAYEARRVRRGLYIRVDMPGVPNDGVKVVKYNDTRTVTFSGKAPPPTRWPGFEPESDTRVYGGYVVIDRDLADVNFETHCKHGSLRMFFPHCDGSLHFLSPPPQNPFTPGSDGEESCPSITSFIRHDPDQSASGITLAGGAPEDINPYQLSGFRGVYEHKVVNVEGRDQMIYVRLDVPDTCEKHSVILDNLFSNRGLVFGASAFKNEYYSRFDEGVREYFGIISPTCECCKYSLVRFANENGVLRVLICKSDSISDPNTAVHFRRIPSRLSRHMQPSTVDMLEHLSGTMKLRLRNLSTQPLRDNSDPNPIHSPITRSRQHRVATPHTRDSSVKVSKLSACP